MGGSGVYLLRGMVKDLGVKVLRVSVKGPRFFGFGGLRLARFGCLGFGLLFFCCCLTFLFLSFFLFWGEGDKGGG